MRIGDATSLGYGSIGGNDAVCDPFSIATLRASSTGTGAINALSSRIGSFGGKTFGYGMSRSRGSVITPVSAAAAAVSGLHRNNRSSFTPERPSKLRGVVRSEFLPAAGACPIPWQPLHPA